MKKVKLSDVNLFMKNQMGMTKKQIEAFKADWNKHNANSPIVWGTSPVMQAHRARKKFFFDPYVYIAVIVDNDIYWQHWVRKIVQLSHPALFGPCINYGNDSNGDPVTYVRVVDSRDAAQGMTFSYYLDLRRSHLPRDYKDRALLEAVQAHLKLEE